MCTGIVALFINYCMCCAVLGLLYVYVCVCVCVCVLDNDVSYIFYVLYHSLCCLGIYRVGLLKSIMKLP